MDQRERFDIRIFHFSFFIFSINALIVANRRHHHHHDHHHHHHSFFMMMMMMIIIFHFHFFYLCIALLPIMLLQTGEKELITAPLADGLILPGVNPTS